MDKLMARAVLEAGRTDDKFAEVKKEIDLRSTLAVIYYTNAIQGFRTHLFSSELVIMMDDGSDIRIDFNTFCSDEWKTRMLHNRCLPACLSKYGVDWAKSEKKGETNVSIVAAGVLIAMIGMVLWAMDSLDVWGLISIAGLIVIGTIKRLKDHKSGYRQINWISGQCSYIGNLIS